jgi:hypothetical protein
MRYYFNLFYCLHLIHSFSLFHFHFVFFSFFCFLFFLFYQISFCLVAEVRPQLFSFSGVELVIIISILAFVGVAGHQEDLLQASQHLENHLEVDLVLHDSLLRARATHQALATEVESLHLALHTLRSCAISVDQDCPFPNSTCYRHFGRLFRYL